MTASPLPDPPAGVRRATGRDWLHQMIWVWRSLLWERVFTTRTTAGQRTLSVILLLSGVALVVIGLRYGAIALVVVAASLLIVLGGVLLASKARSRNTHRLTYVLDDGTATMTIYANREYWTIADHNRAPSAQGAGERLQDLLLAPAAAAADAVDAGFKLTAAAPRLAERYASKLPGLLEVGPAFPYGIAMYRPSVSQRRKLAELDDSRDA